MKVYRPIASKTEQIFVKEMLEIADRIVADYSFQSKSRWDTFNRQKFIESVILNMAPSKFIFADTKACAATANTKDDKTYFESAIKRDIDFLNIDSNNRVTSIKMFVRDVFPLKPAKYEINGTIYEIKKDVNDRYSTLPTALKIAFETASITVERCIEATREQLSDIFIRMNDGKPLNEPEKRNATISDVANTVRDLASDYESYIIKSKLFSEGDVTRRKFDEFIATCAMHFFHGRTAKTTAITFSNMYDATSEYQQSISSFSKRFKEFMKVVGKNAPDLGYKNALLDLFLFYNEMRSEGYTLQKENYNNFIDSYKTVLTTGLADETDIEYESGRKAIFRELLRNKKYIQYRMSILEEYGFDPTQFAIKLDKNRSADKATRMIVAERDGYKTFEGVEIERGTLLTSAFEPGHIIPHSLGEEAGGVTTVDNTVMQTREDNRKTGAKVLTA